MGKYQLSISVCHNEKYYILLHRPFLLPHGFKLVINRNLISLQQLNKGVYGN